MKNRTVAILLAFFLGGIGVHKFYLGETLMGVLYLVFCWTMIPSLIAFIEFILLIIKPQEEFDAKYNAGQVSA
jgi:TM2 domain-containing membrane protein YozV